MVDPASALSFLSPPPSQLHLPGKHVPVAICFLSDGSTRPTIGQKCLQSSKWYELNYGMLGMFAKIWMHVHKFNQAQPA